jgi:hypothetical protein
MTVTMTIAAAVGLVSATATGVGIYYQNQYQLARLEARIGDLPTRQDMTDMRQDYDARMRAVLKGVTWWCPPQVRKGPAVWVECKASFETNPAPPAHRDR